MKASMRPDSMVNQNVASLSSLGNFSKQHINRIIQEAYPLVTTSLMIALNQESLPSERFIFYLCVI
jgi:hypothetical protein